MPDNVALICCVYLVRPNLQTKWIGNQQLVITHEHAGLLNLSKQTSFVAEDNGLQSGVIKFEPQICMLKKRILKFQALFCLDTQKSIHICTCDLYLKKY